MTEEPLTEDELDELERLTAAATPGPWTANIEAEAPIGGDSMIALDGLPDDFPPDMYVFHDRQIAPTADIEFIAARGTTCRGLSLNYVGSGDIPERSPKERLPGRGGCEGD